MSVRWGGNAVTWENAPDDVKDQFALDRLFWFYRMVANGGPDGTDLDTAVYEEAAEAADWYGPRLKARAERAVPL